MQQASKNEQAAKSSRRGFFQLLVGALGVALSGRTAAARSATVEGPISASPTVRSARSPGLDWDRVVPGTPGAVSGWRNKRTGELRTVTFRLAESPHVIRFRLIDPQWLPALESVRS